MLMEQPLYGAADGSFPLTIAIRYGYSESK